MQTWLIILISVSVAVILAGSLYLVFSDDDDEGAVEEAKAEQDVVIEWKAEYDAEPPKPVFMAEDSDEC